MEKIMRAVMGVMAALVCGAGAAHAAELYISPRSASPAVGEAFTVGVYASSEDQPMNAASGIVSFPADALEVVSLSKGGSVFSSWIQEPGFSNAAGTANFEGIVLNPGFKGAGGKIMGITFRAKAPGTASLSISGGSVLANDGKGTSILSGVGGASIAVRGSQPAVPAWPSEEQGVRVPAAPAIASPTHPEQGKWYADNSPKFLWKVPGGVTAVRLLYDNAPRSAPSVLYSSPISEKRLEGVEDGTWYFHAQLRNDGGWSDAAHFKFRIDTHAPEGLAIEFPEGNAADNPRPVVRLEAKDALSGIAYYTLKAGEGEAVWVSVEEAKQGYALPLQEPGTRTLFAEAFDNAGNRAASAADFTVRALEAPEMGADSYELESGDALILRGTTRYANSQVRIWLQHGKDGAKEYAVRSGEDGSFVFVSPDRARSGTYLAWADVTDGRGARSMPSGKAAIEVRQPALVRAAWWMAGLLACLMAILFYMRRGSRGKKEGELPQEPLEALRRDVRAQLALLDEAKKRRELTDEEKRIAESLAASLGSAEGFAGEGADGRDAAA
jgi:hypothetical protein